MNLEKPWSRRGFLKTGAVLSGAAVLSTGALGCGGGIKEEGIFGPGANLDFYTGPLLTGLDKRPDATWGPLKDLENIILLGISGNIGSADTNGYTLNERLIPITAKNSLASHPNYEKLAKSIILQVDHSNDISEIYSKQAFGGDAKKLLFEDLPEGKYEYPTLSPYGRDLVFTFNNKMYISKYLPNGTAITRMDRYKRKNRQNL